ncbi:potassium-transporting ATPase subunit C [Streptomyces sp. NPDC056723]|uniref:potassium-transporting ATPase subunit C n=1 Tax=unclassified Streptomyces TaxID=2593676 RepID=UPI00368DF4A5
MNNSVKNTARLLGAGLRALLVLTLVSGATNLAGDNKDLIGQVEAAQKAVIKDNSTATYKVKKSDVPADAVTSSGSGLDPDISPEYANLQVHRIAEKNHLSVSQVDKLVKNHTSSRILGFMGEPRDNVLELNIALKDLAAKG